MKNNQCVEYFYTDKSRYMICLTALEKLLKQAHNANKEAYIVIAIRKNESEIVVINGEVKVEKQKRKK